MEIKAKIEKNQIQTFKIHDDISLEGKVKKDFGSNQIIGLKIYRINEESQYRYIIEIKQKSETSTFAVDFVDLLPYLLSLTEIKENGKSVETPSVRLFECMDNHFTHTYSELEIYFTRPICVIKTSIGLTKPKNYVEYHYYLTKNAVLPLWGVKTCNFDISTKEMVSGILCKDRVNEHGDAKCRGMLLSGSELIEFIGQMEKIDPNVETLLW